MFIDVCFTAQALTPSLTAGKLAVVIDVFRTTTTITTALAHGARRVLPVSQDEEIQHAKNRFPGALLAGESRGEKREGFDLGNSPLEYTPETVANRTIILSTTNGTAAIRKAAGAKEIYLGSFLNAQALAAHIQQRHPDIIMACAGTQGTFSLEDTCCAGYLIHLVRQSSSPLLSDSAAGALAIYQHYQGDLPGHLSRSQNGTALLAKGLWSEIEYCCTRNCLSLLPVLNPQSEITAYANS